jgi:hypothetical protein
VEAGDWEMILYQESELVKLLGHVNQFIWGDHIPCVSFHVNTIKRYMLSSVFNEMLRYPRRYNILNIDLGGLQYVSPKDHASKKDVKEIYDIIFRLELKKVPLIVNSFPEIAKWRLEIGK